MEVKKVEVSRKKDKHFVKVFNDTMSAKPKVFSGVSFMRILAVLGLLEDERLGNTDNAIFEFCLTD